MMNFALLYKNLCFLFISNLLILSHINNLYLLSGGTMEETTISNRGLYRLPWTLPDNAISWLEPTAMCNLSCDGCYRENEKNSHKPFEEVKNELDVFAKYRNTDCISIAGGDPLLYPHILELVKEIKNRGLKPIVNTNGKALT